MEKLTENLKVLKGIREINMIRFVSEKDFKPEIFKDDKGNPKNQHLVGAKNVVFAIGNLGIFNVASNDEICIALRDPAKKRNLAEISFVDSTYKKGDVDTAGFRYVTHFFKDDIMEEEKFEQDLEIERSRASLHIKEQEARIKKDYFVDANVELTDLEGLLKGKG